MDTDFAAEVFKTNNESEGRIMSERVQSLARSVYEEFENMIKRYDEDVVKELMPLVVGILENLDNSFSDKQEYEVELELVKEDNQQLLAQYDREKHLRRSAEQKLLEIEDAVEEDRKANESKIESLESLVRMLELKSKNTSDHASRLEEKESEMKKEFSKLHDRYTELFKTHMDYVERTKPLLNERSDHGNSPRGRGFVMPTLRPVHVHHETVRVTEVVQSASIPPDSVQTREIAQGPSLNNELESTVKNLDDKNTENTNDKPLAVDSKSLEILNKSENIRKKVQYSNTEDSVSASTESRDAVVPSSKPSGATDDDVRKTMAKIVESTPELEEFDDASYGSSLGTGARHSISRVTRTSIPEDSIFDELNYEDSDFISDMDDGADITGVGKEFESLIQENAELLATKNALNIVKDDLIAQVDELNSEVEMVKGELKSFRVLCDRYKERISELEEQIKKQKEEFDSKLKGYGEDDEDVSRAQRKRFTRVEMARVLMERNQYKERLMELQEAVRWTEMMRASREHPDLTEKPKNKSGIWNFFGNLFGDGSSEESQKAKEAKSLTKAKYTKGPGLPKHI